MSYFPPSIYIYIYILLLSKCDCFIDTTTGLSSFCESWPQSVHYIEMEMSYFDGITLAAPPPPAPANCHLTNFLHPMMHVSDSVYCSTVYTNKTLSIGYVYLLYSLSKQYQPILSSFKPTLYFFIKGRKHRTDRRCQADNKPLLGQ